MKVLILIALYLGTSFAQHGGSSHSMGGDPSRGLNPPTPAERAAIAAAQYKKNVADAATLLQVATQLKADIENQATQTVSTTTVKEAEQIEKLAHGIRNRLKH